MSARFHQRLSVPCRYDVHFTDDALEPANPVLAGVLRAGANRHGPPRALAFLDAGLAAARPDLAGLLAAYGRAHGLRLVGPSVYPGGEAIKDGWGHVQALLGELAEAHLCRHSYVLAIGGGAFLDAVGLAASLAHRGLRLVRLPSTTLAMDDSGIGVKNGINLFGQKNFAGCFASPWAVVNDFGLLRTLPREVLADGLAEAFKVALIKDAAFFARLADWGADLLDPGGAPLRQAVRRCAELHLDHLAHGGDPFERGSARPLDFGHWSAHRLEALSGYQLRHGQAVAIGIALDCRYAREQGLLSTADCQRVHEALAAVGLPTWHPLLAETGGGRPVVLEGLAQFREHLGGRLTLTLPQGIGSACEIHEVDEGCLRRCLTPGVPAS